MLRHETVQQQLSFPSLSLCLTERKENENERKCRKIKNIKEKKNRILFSYDVDRHEEKKKKKECLVKLQFIHFKFIILF